MDMMEEDWIPLALTRQKIDTSSLTFINKKSPALRNDVQSCCDWILVTEEHCQKADRHIAELTTRMDQMTLENTRKDDEVSRLLLELGEERARGNQQAARIQALEEDRIVPSSLQSMSSESSPLIQTCLSTIKDKNLVLTTLQQQIPPEHGTEQTSHRYDEANTVSAREFIEEASKGLAAMTEYVRKQHRTYDTESLLSYSPTNYVHQLAVQGGLPFLDFICTVLDNADAIQRKSKNAASRDELVKVFELSKFEVNVMAHVCEYLVGSEYSWEFSFLYLMVELAGHRSSNSIKSLSAALPGAPSLTQLNSHVANVVKLRKEELSCDYIPDHGDVVMQHDNASGKGYFRKASRQTKKGKTVPKGNVCTLILALMTKNEAKPEQFLQSQTKNAPYYVWDDLPNAPPALLEHTAVEKSFLKDSFLIHIQTALTKMIEDNYKIGDGSKEKNPCPNIHIPNEADRRKTKVERCCTHCGEIYPWSCRNKICRKVLQDDSGEDYICGFSLPTKAEALISYILDERNLNDEDVKFRAKYTADVDNAPIDYTAEQEAKLKKRIISAAKLICDGGDPRDFIHHQSGVRQGTDDPPSSPNIFSQKMPQESSSSSSFYCRQNPHGPELDEAVSSERRKMEALQTQKVSGTDGDGDDNGDADEGEGSSEKMKLDGMDETKRRRSLGIFRTSKAARHTSPKSSTFTTTVIPAGIYHGNPSERSVIDELDAIELKMCKVDQCVSPEEKAFRRFIAKCTDLGAINKHFYRLRKQLLLLPWLHTLMNENKKCLDLIKNGDNSDYSLVAQLYGYNGPNAHRHLFSNGDNHKSQDFNVRHFFPGGVMHLTHTGVDILGQSNPGLELCDMTPQMVYDAIHAQEGATCKSFIALVEEALHPFSIMCTTVRMGPDFQSERIAAQKCWIPLSNVLGQKDYFPALTWDVINRDFLYSKERNPEMHEWMKNVAVVRTNDEDIWLAIDELIEHWVRKWKSCVSSVSERAYDFAEALAADIDVLKEKLSFLLGQLQANKQDRPWTDLSEYTKDLVTFFDHHGTGRGTNDTVLRSYSQSEEREAYKGVDKLIARGKILRDDSYANLRRNGFFNTVPKSALGKGYNDDDDSASDDDGDGDGDERGDEKACNAEMTDA